MARRANGWVDWSASDDTRALASVAMATITHLTELDASPSAVWKLLTDTDASQRYAPVRSIAIERPGHDDPDGVGQVRAIKTWAGTVREEVTTFEPERCFGYTLLSGVPVRNYRGTITLEPCERGTRYRWEIQLEAAWYLLPVLIMITKRTVRSTVRGLAEELARRAED